MPLHWWCRKLPLPLGFHFFFSCNFYAHFYMMLKLSMKAKVINRYEHSH